MQKKIGLVIVGISVILTLVVMFIVFNRQKDDANYHHSVPPPPPTERVENQKEGEEKESEREAFFEKMHKAAPGTNWRKMDADLRYQKMEARKGLFNAKIQDTDWDTLANGNVVGK